MSDPFAANVVLHLPLDSSISGSSVVQDGTVQANTATLFGDAAISSEEGRFTGKACKLDGNADGISYSAQIVPGTGDFTLEAWAYVNSYAPYYQGIFNVGNYSNGMLLRLNGGGIETWVNNTQYTTPGAVPIGAWTHVAWCRASGILRTFVGGIGVGEQSAPGNIQAGAVQIGASAHISNEALNGYLNDVRMTLAARYTADFTPPGRFAVTTTQGVLILQEPDSPMGLSTYPVPTPTLSLPDVDGRWRDYYLGGTGKIVGTVKQKGTSSDAPVVRRVRLHQMRSGLLVDETWSDANGNYQFNYLNTADRYYAVAFDHLDNYRGVIADNLSPVAA